MTIVAIPEIRDLGTVPNNGMEESVYSATAEAFTGQMPGWGADNKAVAEAGRTNALHAAGAADSASSSASTANGRAEAASVSAGAASTKAGEAADSASSAAASLAAMQKLYLGNKAAHPAVDNQGAALQKGAWYTNSTSSYWYWWNGISWIVGVGDLNAVDWATQVINKPLLVNSVNGLSGVVTGLVEAASGTLGAALMSTAPLGQWASFNSPGAAPADWPSTLPGTWWNVFTFGVDGRKTQIAFQVFETTEQSSMFVRSLHDSNWSAWQRFFGDMSLRERSKYVPSPGSAYTASSRAATLHYIDISSPLTVTVPAALQPGEQMTMMFSFPSVASVVFSANVRAPVGGIRAGVAGHVLTVPLIAREGGSWQAYDGGLHAW